MPPRSYWRRCPEENVPARCRTCSDFKICVLFSNRHPPRAREDSSWGIHQLGITDATASGARAGGGPQWRPVPPELLKAPGGGLRVPSAHVYWKKERNIKHQTGVKARERAFFGAATPVRARGQGFREWGGNSNFKRNLSLSVGELGQRMARACLPPPRGGRLGPPRLGS